MRKYNKLIVPFLVILVLVGCAGTHSADESDNIPGFFSGIIHGIFILVRIILRGFGQDYPVYECINSGWGYDIGFWIGSSVTFFSARSR